MNRHCTVSVCVIVIGLFLGISMAAAQETPIHEYYDHYGEGEWMEPAEETATVQSVTTIVSNPVVINPTFSAIPAPTPAAPSIMPGTIEASLQSLYSSPIQVYSIPLSYAFTENIKMELSVPYVRKQLKGEYTGADLTASGLGDITVGGKYRYGDIDRFQWITSFYLKLPTGKNEQFEDQHERLALGTGSYDFIINQSVSKLFGNFLTTANVGYTINTTGDYTETNNWGVNVRYENRAGNVFNYMAGAEYYTPARKLLAYANLAGIIMGHSHIKETYEDFPFLNRDEDKQDGLKTLDLIAGVKYMFSEKRGLRLGIIAPLWTTHDNDAIDAEGRDWLIDFGLSSRF
jgi:hypothetical protein